MIKSVHIWTAEIDIMVYGQTFFNYRSAMFIGSVFGDIEVATWRRVISVWSHSVEQMFT